MKKLKTIPVSLNLKNVPVLVRVDWNIPLNGLLEAEHHLKLQRSKPLLKELCKRGAKVLLFTHLGRPKKREDRYSTKHLVPIVKKAIGIDCEYLGFSVSNPKQLARIQEQIKASEAGSIQLLENVRFEKGEETMSKTLAKAYASLAKYYVNDAFASSHRKHVSTVGIAQLLKSFAGPALVSEVQSLEKVLQKPAHPFYVVMGGKKLSTKMGVIKTLMKHADVIMMGSAMSVPFLQSEGFGIGKSFQEPAAKPLAKKLLATGKIVLPVDVMTTTELSMQPKLEEKRINEIGKNDMIVDIGLATLKQWHQALAQAKTILWNGPVGITEIKATSWGTEGIAKSIAKHNTKSYSVVGGGDTLPIISSLGLQKKIDVLSTGGGAMLDFIASEGDLPGLKPLR